MPAHPTDQSAGDQSQMKKSRTAQIDQGDDGPPYVPKPMARVIAWEEVRPFHRTGHGFKHEQGPKWLKCRGEAGCVSYAIEPVGGNKTGFCGYRLDWYDERKSELAQPELIRRARNRVYGVLFDSIEQAQSAAQAHSRRPAR